MPEMTNDQTEPRWIERAKHLDHKPGFVDGIPDQLKELGEVFFPIPPKKKGWKYPHSKDEYRYGPYSEVLNAYLESGWGYGIACDNDLVVVDIDEYEYISDVTNNLPQSLYQISGSGEGVHIFYKVPGQNTRKKLYSDPDDDEESEHVGEIKADPHGYVVGPGSTHPCGAQYGPLHGDGMAEVDKEDLLDSLDHLITDKSTEEVVYEENYSGGGSSSDSHAFYNLTADDVAPGLSAGERTANPFHGSTTGTNFMKNEGGDTFTCWRCQYGRGDGCGLSGGQFMAAKFLQRKEPNKHCQKVRERWKSDMRVHYYGWLQSVSDGLITIKNPPFSVVAGYGIEKDMINHHDEIDHETYHTLKNSLLYDTQVLLQY